MQWTSVSHNLFNRCCHFAYGDAAMWLKCVRHSKNAIFTQNFHTNNQLYSCNYHFCDNYSGYGIWVIVTKMVVTRIQLIIGLPDGGKNHSGIVRIWDRVGPFCDQVGQIYSKRGGGVGGTPTFVCQILSSSVMHLKDWTLLKMIQIEKMEKNGVYVSTIMWQSESWMWHVLNQ